MIQNIKGNACAGDHVHNCSVKCHLRTTMNPVHFEFLLKAGQGRLHQLRFTSVDFSFFLFRSRQISLLLHVIQLFPCRPSRSTFTGDTCFTKVANGRTLILLLLLFQTREGAIVATLPQWSWSISSLFKQPILNLIETGCQVISAVFKSVRIWHLTQIRFVHLSNLYVIQCTQVIKVEMSQQDTVSWQLNYPCPETDHNQISVGNG